MISVRTLTLVACTAVFAVGCSSTKLQEKPAPVTEAAPKSAPTQPAPQTGAVTPVETAPMAMDPLNDPKGALANRSVYFDFDSSSVKPESQGVIEAHGRYLASNKGRHVTVEGNCDERGGREYNLALGQRRADAVRQRLTLLGATDAQIESISNGKEKPRAMGHDEAAWAENRRADIVYR
ncbi:MAG TPA: peptidoglycan-associated lipoprotein Pal [Burkholderiaceae bacterium]|nr:peptidoglycan-associated lipoprotein Pal [Burkholderiaceae bacterium]